MRIELIMTGDELMDGRVVNRNASDISSALTLAGFEVQRAITVGDDPEHLKAVFKEVSERADIGIITGGLGPTDDDRTVEVFCELTGSDLVFYPEVLEKMQKFFDKIGRKMSENNKKQAYQPSNSLKIENHWGTAPGFQIGLQGCQFFALPGVPREMIKMLEHSLIPTFQEMAGDDYVKPVIQLFKTFGLAESQVDEELKGLYPLPPEVEIGYRSNFPEVHIRLKVRAKTQEKVEKLSKQYALLITDTLKEYIYTQTGQSFVQRVAELLIQKGKTLALAESCTGGLISQMITKEPGASEYFTLSAVTYSNQAKMDILGVNEATLIEHGAVSEAVAREMAEGARKAGKADIAVAVTGIAGPDGGTDEKPVGTVHTAIAVEGYTHHHKFQFPGSRSRVQKLTAYLALDMVRKQLLRKPS